MYILTTELLYTRETADYKKWGANAPQNLLHILKSVQELNHLLSCAEALVVLIALIIALNQADAFSPLYEQSQTKSSAAA